MHQPAPLKTASWATLVCTLVALGCGDNATGPDPDPNPNPSVQIGDVSVESSINLVMAIGRSTQLTATVTDTDGSSVAAPSLNWESSDPNVAGVSGSGLVIGIGAGQATITATYGGVSGNLPITIIDADLDGIAQLRNDPLMVLLVTQLETELAQQLSTALNTLDGAITVGDCIAVRDALQAALTGTSGSTDPGDVVTLAVLGLVLERAQDLLGLN